MGRKRKSKIICIYCFRNKINNKYYVGQTNNYKKRMGGHLTQLRQNKSPCIKLQRAWNKYGEDDFEISILEQLETKDNLDIREVFWIEKFNSFNKGYNSTTGGAAFREMSLDSRERINKNRKGKKLPPRRKDWCENISKSLTGNPNVSKPAWNKGIKGENSHSYGKKKPQAEIDKVARANYKKIYCIELNKTYNSIKEASETLKIVAGNIGKVCKGEREKAGGYSFRFI